MTKRNDRFAELVKSKGESQAAIGNKLGNVPGQRIGQYISGRQNPKEEFFRKWQTVYGEDIRGMFVETNVSHETKPMKEERDMSNLIESNKELCVSNRSLSEAHKLIVEAHHELIQILKASYSRPAPTVQETPGVVVDTVGAADELRRIGHTGAYVRPKKAQPQGSSGKKGR